MFFNSFYYFVFLGVTFVLFYSFKKYRWFILFLASLFFIGTISPNLIFFALLFSILNYFLGISLETTKNKVYKKRIFWLGISLDIGLLASFKYINFVFENLNFILRLFPEVASIPYINIIVPLGISYYTFQALGYLIRINRGAEKAEHNFGIFATYLLFFPKFLSGPVERSNHFFPQINSSLDFQKDNISTGLRLFLWGMFKKDVIGNNLAGPVMLVYGDVENYHGIPLIIVFLLQTVHLYCDFSGYTDMALGSARIFGIQLGDNFNRPFFAKNVGEFWRRWHISLSSWCNDFIFTPFIVKYRKLKNKAAILGIFITFFVIGIWHGAKWTFVILGILQGIAISYEFYTKRKRITLAKKLQKKWVVFFSRIFTFLFFCLTLIFFNANSVSDAFYYITHLFSGIEWKFSGHDLVYDKNSFIVGIVGFLFIFIIEYFNEQGEDLMKKFIHLPLLVRWTGYYALIILIYLYGGGDEAFVYLKF
ncbi:MAG: MBOAT family O-acyltransferase [Bacteroidales bacterium]